MKIYRFTASWCQPCKALAKNLEAANLSNPIEVIDIDENSDMAIQYNIRSVPTLMLEGKENRLVGVHTPEKIREWANG